MITRNLLRNLLSYVFYNNRNFLRLKEFWFSTILQTNLDVMKYIKKPFANAYYEITTYKDKLAFYSVFSLLLFIPFQVLIVLLLIGWNVVTIGFLIIKLMMMLVLLLFQFRLIFLVIWRISNKVIVLFANLVVLFFEHSVLLIYEFYDSMYFVFNFIVSLIPKRFFISSFYKYTYLRKYKKTLIFLKYLIFFIIYIPLQYILLMIFHKIFANLDPFLYYVLHLWVFVNYVEWLDLDEDIPEIFDDYFVIIAFVYIQMHSFYGNRDYATYDQYIPDLPWIGPFDDFFIEGYLVDQDEENVIASISEGYPEQNINLKASKNYGEPSFIETKEKET